MRRTAALRARLSRAEILVAPGAADALTARVIEEAGFDAVYVTGAGIANASLAAPDIGLTTMSEVVSHVWLIANAVDVPVIADADTGFGGFLNVVRTVRELERAGAAGIQIEDQVSPKRCGHFDGKEVISASEMVAKIEAATYAREDPDLVLIARTDARAGEGLDAAIERGRTYAAAGADVVFVEAPQTLDELGQLPKAIPAPLLVNMVEGGKTPLLDSSQLETMGYRIVIFPNTALRVAIKAVQQALEVLRRDGTTRALLERMVTWDERQRLVGLAQYAELDRRFAASAQAHSVAGRMSADHSRRESPIQGG